ncbi:TMEM165/GDT1 family protein [Paraneptunicella aestuarii]|uniref:TMEM165/GDT1 family protein n=1 Tax=Paraneptunicella aestuarii TaxID=2831148 RepID=UPI001E3440FC|nr:TMEM165/GDT1 family protein [Paraneptunicella aestuarii]UAA40241.1 TMEM165/GDT1 family protein [Paraneptunicella aestuarii]
MEFKVFLTIFFTVFLAELGDKTQLATVLFASEQNVSKWMVFLAASAALVVSAGLGVLVGDTLSHYIDEKVLNYIAGALFIVIGLFTLYKA